MATRRKTNHKASPRKAKAIDGLSAPKNKVASTKTATATIAAAKSNKKPTTNPPVIPAKKVQIHGETNILKEIDRLEALEVKEQEYHGDILAESKMMEMGGPLCQRRAEHRPVSHAFAGRRGDHAPDAAGGRSDGYKHSGVILLQFPPGGASGVPLGELAANAVSRLRGYWSSNTFFALTPPPALRRCCFAPAAPAP